MISLDIVCFCLWLVGWESERKLEGRSFIVILDVNIIHGGNVTNLPYSQGTLQP